MGICAPGRTPACTATRCQEAWLPGGRARDAYEATVAALSNGHPGVSLGAVATAKARMDRAQANRTGTKPLHDLITRAQDRKG